MRNFALQNGFSTHISVTYISHSNCMQAVSVFYHALTDTCQEEFTTFEDLGSQVAWTLLSLPTKQSFILYWLTTLK